LEDDDELLDLLVREAVDRTLSYTNRTQLIRDWEEAVDLYGYEPDEENNEEYNREVFDYDGGYFNGEVPCPIPVMLRKGLARLVVQLYKTVTENISNSSPAISSISDNGQSVSYSNNVQSYLAGKEDTDFFSGMTGLLNKFRMATV
jgi:hypothetical protein